MPVGNVLLMQIKMRVSPVIDYILSFESFELNYVRKKKEFEHKGKKIITKIGAVFKLQRAIIVHIYFI